jgi:hypothetical protein
VRKAGAIVAEVGRRRSETIMTTAKNVRVSSIFPLRAKQVNIIKRSALDSCFKEKDKFFTLMIFAYRLET